MHLTAQQVSQWLSISKCFLCMDFVARVLRESNICLQRRYFNYTHAKPLAIKTNVRRFYFSFQYCEADWGTCPTNVGLCVLFDWDKFCNVSNLPDYRYQEMKGWFNLKKFNCIDIRNLIRWKPKLLKQVCACHYYLATYVATCMHV